MSVNMEQPKTFLPGDNISAALFPTSQKRKPGAGILPSSTDSDTYTSTLAGPLQIDHRKKTASIANPHARYQPRQGDLVIAQVRGSAAEYYHCSLSPHGGHQAILHSLSFEGATKKTRPKLEINDLVYAKVIFAPANANMEIELSCVNPQTGKAEVDGLGPLTSGTGGMVFDVSVGLAERIMRRDAAGVEFLGELGARLTGGFELITGRNGKVWVDCGEGNVRGTCAVGKCLREVDERLRSGEGLIEAKAQKKMVGRVLGEFGIS